MRGEFILGHLRGSRTQNFSWHFIMGYLTAICFSIFVTRNFLDVPSGLTKLDQITSDRKKKDESFGILEHLKNQYIFKVAPSDNRMR